MARASSRCSETADWSPLDFNGKQLWHYSFGETSNYHGPAGSPLLYKDRIIFYQDQRTDSFIAAIDAKTGKLALEDAASGKGSAGARRPRFARAITTRLSSTDNSRFALTIPPPGRELWSVRGNTMEVIPAPVVGQGLLFCSSGRAGPTLAIRPGGKGDVTDTHVAWQTPRGSPFIPSPLVHGDYSVPD
jgi:outer membrane protein assembly factor BamB